jgi:acid phosphatase family membrane protein YuiD
MNGEDASFSVWVRALVRNPVFLAPLTAFFAAQIIKTLVLVVVKKERRGKVILSNLLWRTGGVPSSHAAISSSLVTAIALHEGLNSTSFIIALFLAGIVIRDALGVRRAAGLQAEALNALARGLSKKIELDWQPVKEIHGHTPLEVVLGGTLGILDALLLRYI